MLYRVLHTAAEACWRVPLVALASVPHIEVPGTSLGPLSPGEATEVLKPLAEILLRSGLVRIDTRKLPTSVELSKLLWIEDRSERLQKLDEDFLQRVRTYVTSLEKMVSEGSAPVNPLLVMQELQQVKTRTLDLMRRRLCKILRQVLLNPTPSQEILEKLTLEERILYLKLCDIVGSWVKFLEETFR